MNLLQQMEAEQVEKMLARRAVPIFQTGDTVKVSVKVVEGTRERIQAYEGVCIARRNAGVNSAFTVRKLSYGEGVERVFPLYSPKIESIEVIRRGDTRRAKLYYLRGRTGKRARIAEKTDGYSAKIAAAQRAEQAIHSAQMKQQASKKTAEKAALAAQGENTEEKQT